MFENVTYEKENNASLIISGSSWVHVCFSADGDDDGTCLFGVGSTEHGIVNVY